MNWVWLKFATLADATEFVRRLDERGLEHRGVYGADDRDGPTVYPVRVRPWEHWESCLAGLNKV